MKKPKYRYMITGDLTEYFISLNAEAEQLAGRFWCRYYMCQWFSEKEFDRFMNEQEKFNNETSTDI